MDALERFEAEHREALQELERLEAACDRLERGDDRGDALATVREVHRFLSTAVRDHNEREERILFPLLGEDGPCEPFLDEHQALRQLERDIEVGLDADLPVDAVVRPARELVDLLRSHIDREDRVLFPVARHRLGPGGLAELDARFDAMTT